MFRALLLGTWYPLSDVQLAQCSKRDYGLARTRFMGLAKHAPIFGLAAMVANIRKGTQILVLYGVPKPCSTE
ncbi:MAG: hypothetical protein KAG53_01800 [Endozoicomonadaceae bacterium]|nr:hypothetical protein [Endozoicomonadaceae bacterium]